MGPVLQVSVWFILKLIKANCRPFWKPKTALYQPKKNPRPQSQNWRIIGNAVYFLDFFLLSDRLICLTTLSRCRVNDFPISQQPQLPCSSCHTSFLCFFCVKEIFIICTNKKMNSLSFRLFHFCIDLH